MEIVIFNVGRAASLLDCAIPFQQLLLIAMMRGRVYSLGSWRMKFSWLYYHEMEIYCCRFCWTSGCHRFGKPAHVKIFNFSRAP